MGLNPDLYHIQWLDEILRAGEAQFVATDEAAMVVEIRIYPTGVKGCVVVVAAGSATEIIHTLRPNIEAWGREMGCTKGLVESFPAWAKLLKPYGYSPFKLSLIKDL